MSAAMSTDTGTYLSFRLGEEDFAADITQVREVLEYPVITQVPRMPDYVCGVTNLRGSVVPVVDMRLKFGMPEAERTVDTCVIIMEVLLDAQPVVIGCLVDSVKEVFEMDAGQIEAPPRMGTCINSDFIKGMGAVDERFLMILDMTRILSTQELLLVTGAVGQVDE